MLDCVVLKLIEFFYQGGTNTELFLGIKNETCYFFILVRDFSMLKGF